MTQIANILSGVSLGESPTPSRKPLPFDLSVLGKKPVKKKSKGKVYPSVPDPTGDLALAGEDFVEKKEQLSALEGAVDGLKGEFKEGAVPFYFDHFNGKSTIDSSVQIGDHVLVSFMKRYHSTPSLDSVVELIGEENTGRLFQSGFSIKIDGFQIPPEHAQIILERIGGVFAEFDCTDAIQSEAIVKPTEAFHTERHRLLDTQTNRALHELVPMTIAVKVKK